jgi:hypothetical protein
VDPGNIFASNENVTCGSYAKYVLDGNTGTGWGAPAPIYFGFNFKKPTKVVEFALTNSTVATAPTAFTIEVSNDGGATWSALQSYSTTWTSGGQTKTFTIDVQADAAPFLAAHTGTANNTGGVTTTTGIDTTGANLLVVGANYDYTLTPTLSESKGNSCWVALPEYGGAPSQKSRLYYCVSPTNVGPNHTFTINTGTFGATVFVAAFSGPRLIYSTHGGYAPAGLIQTTFAFNNQLQVLLVGSDGGSGPALPSPYITIDTLSFIGGQRYAGGLFYQFQPLPTSTSVNLGGSLGSFSTDTGVEFKPGSSVWSFPYIM